jgi:error-prone DNA polymerase
MHELREIGLAEAALEKLADADAFRSIGLDRRQALWEVSTKDRPTAIFSNQQANGIEERVALPEMTLPEHVAHDYAATSLSIKAHPVSFIREQLDQLHILSTSALAKAKDGDLVKVAGLILVRQRPGTASGICFITIEDETGCANLVVFQKLFDQYRKEILQSSLLMVEGKLQIEGEVIHVIVKRCYNFSRLLRQRLGSREEELSISPHSRADERTAPVLPKKQKVKKREILQSHIFPQGRNFR